MRVSVPPPSPYNGERRLNDSSPRNGHEPRLASRDGPPSTSKRRLKAAQDDVLRLAEGTYLSLLDELFDDADGPAVTEDDLYARFGPGCDLVHVCAREALTVKLF